MPQIPVNVQVDFTGVSCKNGQWSGQPTWNVPGKVSVHPGTNNTIVWNLTARQVPAGFTAAFASNGVDFSTARPAWPGSVPVLQPNGTMQSTDDFAPGLPVTDYYYSLNVLLTGNGSAPAGFRYDPDVQNESN